MDAPSVSVRFHEQALKACNERHEKTIQALEAKVHRLRHLIDEEKKETFTEKQKGETLSKSLGFIDIRDAQCSIDTADEDINFVACYNELHQLRQERDDVVQKEKEISRLKLSQLEQENSMLRSQIKGLRLLNDKLSDDAQDLQKRFDELKDAKSRAADRYKADYRKWRNFKNWIDQPTHAWNEEGLTEEERRKRRIASVTKRKEMFLKMGPDLSNVDGVFDSPAPPPLGGTKIVDEDTDITPTRKRPVSALSDGAAELVLKPIENIPQRPSATVTKVSVKTHDLPLPSTSIHVKEEPASSPASLRGSQPNRVHAPGSSDTEEDSQAIMLPRPGFPGMTFQNPDPMSPTKATSTAKKVAACSSDTEEDSQDLFPSSPTLPPRPNGLPPPRIKREPSTIASPMRHRRPQTERPAKFRRLSTDGSPHRNNKHPSSTPRNVSGPSRLLLLRSEGANAPSKKGKERELDSTPLTRTMGQKKMDDYSAFKGRGRYGKSANATDPANDTTINALFEIDPTANSGKDFQYEEVVRNRDQRKKLDAGDCECCREYYENVGPLPDLPQQPLWRSPSTTPQRPCLRHHKKHVHDENDDPEFDSSPSHAAADTTTHKKQISRHRYAWERAKTPPGFWDIGFPSTQEVNDINERADDLHNKKRKAIDREAASGNGRYRRK